VKPFIKRMDYDSGKQALTVCFQTSTYIYWDVPEPRGRAICDIFQSAEQELAFSNFIEGKYRSERMTT
jgi:hypothetical protein